MSSFMEKLLHLHRMYGNINFNVNYSIQALTNSLGISINVSHGKIYELQHSCKLDYSRLCLYISVNIEIRDDRKSHRSFCYSIQILSIAINLSVKA